MILALPEYKRSDVRRRPGIITLIFTYSILQYLSSDLISTYWYKAKVVSTRKYNLNFVCLIKAFLIYRKFNALKVLNAMLQLWVSTSL
jgi:hypothetical protein